MIQQNIFENFSEYFLYFLFLLPQPQFLTDFHKQGTILKLRISSFQIFINHDDLHEDLTDSHVQIIVNYDLYIVGKRRFSALKWHLVCENQLRIEAVGAKTKNKENIH